MRYFFSILLLFFMWAQGNAQEKTCPFPYSDIIAVDSVTSRRLLDTIKNLQLTSYKKIDNMPACIQKAMNCICNGKFRVARVGGSYYGGCTVGWRNLPRRQLMYLGVNDHYMLITYKKGGNASNCPMMLFQYDNDKIRSVWYWIGFNYEIKTKEDILEYFIHYRSGWETVSPIYNL